MRCEECVECVYQGDGSVCGMYSENPIYAHIPRFSLFRDYLPLCPMGVEDCVYDPAYIHYNYPDWYKQLYGDQSPEEVAQTRCALRIDENGNCSDYDDEDK